MTRAEVLALVAAERARQHAKWGGQHHWGHGDCSGNGFPEWVKLAVLTEETGEVARALHDQDRQALAQELVQVAAVAVAWWEALG